MLKGRLDDVRHRPRVGHSASLWDTRPVPLNTLKLLHQSLSTTGLLVGTLLFATSLSPSLVPRPFMLQAMLSGVAFSAGYGAGVLLHAFWHFLELPEWRGRVLLWGHRLAWLLCAGAAVGFLVRASAWQNSVRDIMGLAPVEGSRPIMLGAIALLIFLFVLGLSKLFLLIRRRVTRAVSRIVPYRIALVIGVLTAMWLFWAVISGVLARSVLSSFDASFSQLDRLMEDTLAAPVHPQQTGSPASHLGWQDIGRQGRRFIAGTPSVEELARINCGPRQEPLRQPLRIYVGLNSAETIDQRVQLAMAELHRVGAFERRYLVLATPTGTGWVDPGGIRSLEYLIGGDIASVALQYSYLPSWLSLMARGGYGTDSARALFDAVYRHWHSLPEDARPRLYLFGLSLGALNSEASADIWDLIGDPIDGALWAGPPFRSRTWQWVTAQRNEDSPAWLPTFRDGSVIRFANQQGGLDDFDAPWGSFRIAYLQYASDPVTFFAPRALYRAPSWLHGDNGPDVSPFLRWYPIVSFLQFAADIAAADTAPIGFGHAFATEHYIDTWYALVQPPGWDAARLQALKALIGDLDLP